MKKDDPMDNLSLQGEKNESAGGTRPDLYRILDVFQINRISSRLVHRFDLAGRGSECFRRLEVKCLKGVARRFRHRCSFGGISSWRFRMEGSQMTVNEGGESC